MGYKSVEAMNKYQREWLRARRAAFLKDKQCQVCGERKNLMLYIGEKIDKRNSILHRVFTMKPKEAAKVLRRTKIFCKTHYQENLNRERGWVLKHGTHAGWKKYKCRCERCHNAIRAVWQRYYIQRRLRLKTLREEQRRALIKKAYELGYGALVNSRG